MTPETTTRDASLIIGLALLATTGLSVRANAQQGVIWKSSRIPSFIEMEGVGGEEGNRILLRASCGPADSSSAPALGTAIVRQIELNGTTAQVASTVTEKDWKRKTLVVDSMQLRSFAGTIFIDKKLPSRLRVNAELWKEAPAYLNCAVIPGTSDTARTAEDRLRDVEFYYELRNRQTVEFSTWTAGFSGVTVPLRYRPGYKASNDAVVAGAVADPLSIGVLFGRTFFGRTRYQYVRDADNPLTQSRGVTLGVVALLGKGTVGPKTSMSAADPLSEGEEASFLTVSTGFAFTVQVRGVEVGFYTAPEYPLAGGASGKWDFKGKWWRGVGLAFNPGK